MAQFKPQVPHILEFTAAVVQDATFTAGGGAGVSLACGMLGDLCKTFGDELAQYVDGRVVAELCRLAGRTPKRRRRWAGTWSTR